MAISPDKVVWLEELFAAFDHDATKTSDWEHGFIKDQMDRWNSWGSDIRLSEKQWAVLERIAAKYNIKPPGDDDPDDVTTTIDLEDELPF